MKKFVCGLLAAVMLLPVCTAGAVELEPKADLTLSYETGAAVGETFEVELQLSGNPGIYTAQATLAYDRRVLECVSCQKGPILSSMMSVVNPSAADGAIIAGASATPVQETGVLAVYSFRVLAPGEYGFILRDMMFAGSDGKAYPVSVTDSSAQSPGGGTGSPGGDSPDEKPSVSFSDTKGHWAEAYIHQAADLNLVNGYGNGRYGPDDNMTRAHFVTILWREAGEPEPTGTASFTDLNPKQSYYHKAVAWAEENGVVNGIGNGLFAPDANVTREQIAVTLYRMEGGTPGGEQMFYGIYGKAFADSALVSDWARAAVWWAVYREIWCGTDSAAAGLTLSPTMAADRAQIAVMMVRYHEL